MRQAVTELVGLGPLPPSDKVVREKLTPLIEKYQRLLLSIQKPVTDEEARGLITIFGPDDCFELAWTLLHLIESAPGWPLLDVLSPSDNEWVELLRIRIENAKKRSLR